MKASHRKASTARCDRLSETVGSRVAAQRFEIGIPVLAGGFQKIQQAAAHAPDRGNFQFARPYRLIEGQRLERFRALHGFFGIIDINRDGADSRAVGDIVRVGKAIRLAIDDQLDIALRPSLHVLAAMRTGLAKTELAEQRGQIPGFGFIDSKFDKSDAAALRFRLQPGRRRACRA